MSYPERPVRVRRRGSRRRRLRRRFLTGATLVLAYLCIWWGFSVRSSIRAAAYQANPKWTQGDLSQNLAMLAAGSVPVPLSVPRRVVYPYSVVPGGVQTADDLRHITSHDDVVGNHYAGFDFRNARIVEVDQPKLVYLSYRVGDKIYWTRKKVSLRRGEMLITDGKMTARTRCANRVSEAAMPETSPAEPPAAKFEEPFDGTAARTPFPGDLNSIMGEHAGGMGPAQPTQISSSVSFPGGGLPPLYPPRIPERGCPPGETSGGNGKPCHHKPPPPAVPEPATLLLVSSGIAGIYWRRKAAVKK